MKYFSEITKHLYDTKDELDKAEAEVVKSKANRAEKAKEVTELIKKAAEANKVAQKALDDFCKEYGSFKTTIKDKDTNFTVDSFWNVFDKFLF